MIASIPINRLHIFEISSLYKRNLYTLSLSCGDTAVGAQYKATFWQHIVQFSQRIGGFKIGHARSFGRIDLRPEESNECSTTDQVGKT